MIEISEAFMIVSRQASILTEHVLPHSPPQHANSLEQQKDKTSCSALDKFCLLPMTNSFVWRVSTWHMCIHLLQALHLFSLCITAKISQCMLTRGTASQYKILSINALQLSKEIYPTTEVVIFLHKACKILSKTVECT
jgi:hypothetical protein